MHGKTKSILLQVAFKEANGDRDQTVANYKTLIELIDTFGIDPDDEKPRNYGGGGNKGGGGQKKASAVPDAPTFLHDGGTWSDYRSLKAQGAVKPNFPDFKNPVTNESVWLLDRDGAPTDKGEELAKVRDTEVM